MSGPAAAVSAAGCVARHSGSPVNVGLTDTHFRGFVRKDEAWPEDSPAYQAGCEIENRKRPPPEEVPGDAFDRQRVIPDFDQGLIERQICLVLGAGGIGQNVALTLARLGVKKIILVDHDIYDASNLTRQSLGGKSDVGLRKVDVAARSLLEQHSLRSQVEAVHCDAVLEWPRVVALAREATAVFNGIDAGVMWDFCVNSLCKELGLPLVCGQSFGWKFMAEMYTGRVQDVCAFCYDSTASTFQANESSVRRRGGVLERLQAFMAGAAMPEGRGAEVGVEVLAAFLAQDHQFKCEGSGLCADTVRSALASMRLPALRPASLADDLLCFLRNLDSAVKARLLPGHISKLEDVAFIPRPVHANTRYVGSWICPCLGCSVIMVSQWAAWLTSPLPEGTNARNPPQTVTFNLDAGLTAEEQLGYELGQLGMPMDMAERRFCRETRREACAVCGAAAALQAEELLFVGRLPAVLAQVPGEVLALPEAWRDPAALDGVQRAAAASRALARQHPIQTPDGDGSGAKAAVLPALPALDWERLPGSTLDLWPPEIMTMPLLKVPAGAEAAGTPSAVQGLVSGERSALVRARGRWWRLKGCGSREEGFPLRSVGDQGELSLRGCCFEHTAETDLRMSALAGAALEAAGLDAANRPAGSYRYAAPSGATWPLPEVTRHCTLSETLGNARLGDHLLAGLLGLLPHFVSRPPGYGFATLRGALAAGRGADPGDLLPTDAVASCGMETADVAAQLAATGSLLDEASPPAAEAMGGSVPHELTGIWDAARTRLSGLLNQSRLASGEPSLLLWLAWRLGWESGATVRALHAAGISWGTYPDAMGIHCNAHANNLVVKPPGAGRAGTFLAALDFDMAFTRDGFLPEATASHASLGLDTWEGLLEFEAIMGMKMVLAGSSFANTGVANLAELPASHSAVEMALRDTLVTAYEAARQGGVDAHPHHGELCQAAYELIKLALCLTTHVAG